MADEREQADLSAFAEHVTEALRSAGVAGNIAYDRTSERLLNETLPDAFYLGEAWNTWRRVSEDERGDWLRRYVEVFLRGRQMPGTWEEAKPGVMVRIRPRVVHACWPLRHELEGLRIPNLPAAELTEHLVVELAWPQKDAISTVLTEDLQRWGVTAEEALEAAAVNLRARSLPLKPWLGSKEFPGVWRSPWKDRFDASRIVFVDGFGLALEGPPVVVAPFDDCLMLADGDDEEALFNLGRAARREAEHRGTFLWLRPLRLDEGRWVHWLPPRESGGFAPLKLLYALNEKDDYDRQGELLQRLIDREDGQTRVSPVHMLQDGEGNTFTATEWEAGRPAALAQTDTVLFRKDQQAVALVPFDRVLEVLGALLDERPDYPKRYLAVSYPDDWQIHSLGLPDG